MARIPFTPSLPYAPLRCQTIPKKNEKTPFRTKTRNALLYRTHQAALHLIDTTKPSGMHTSTKIQRMSSRSWGQEWLWKWRQHKRRPWVRLWSASKLSGLTRIRFGLSPTHLRGCKVGRFFIVGGSPKVSYARGRKKHERRRGRHTREGAPGERIKTHEKSMRWARQSKVESIESPN